MIGSEAGGVAQLGERLLCKQEVIGSIPFTSTNASEKPNASASGVRWRLVLNQGCFDL
jgi:hypothetical protein